MNRYPTAGLVSAAAWSTVAFVFFIPVSTALMNLFLALGLVLLLLSGTHLTHCKTLLAHPFVRAALLLLAYLGVAALYADADPADSWERWLKYAKLLLPALILPLFLQARPRPPILGALLSALALILLGIYAVASGLLDELPREGDPLVHFTVDGGFKTRIITSILAAFAAYAFAVLAIEHKHRRRTLTVLALAAAGYVLILSSGLTGRLVLLGLLVMFWFQVSGLKRGALLVALSLALALPSMYFTSDSLQQRVQNIRHADERVPGRKASSIQERIQLLRNGVAVILDAPLLGRGTGAVRTPGAEGATAVMNIHNQYLMLWAEGGLPALGLLLYLFHTHWRLARSLPPTERRLAYGVLLTMVLGCATNSLITDSGESHFYLLFATFYLYRPGSAAAPAARPQTAAS